VLTGFIVFAFVALFETIAPTPIVLLSIVGTALVQGALVEAVADRHNSRPQSSIADLYRSAWKRAGRLVGVSLLTGIGVGIGLLLLVFPGVILFTRWSLAVPVVMLEGLGPRAAMNEVDGTRQRTRLGRLSCPLERHDPGRPFEPGHSNCSS